MNSSAPTIDPKIYARRWKILAVMSLSLVIIGLDNTILNVALPEPAGALRRIELDAAVDRRLLPARLRRSAPDHGHARRPLRPQARAPGGPRDLRRREPGRARRGQREPADRDPCGDGRRRRAHHARDAVDHHERLSARGARQGDRHLGRHGRDRHRPRAAVRRPPAGVVLLDVRVPGQRARHGHRHPRRRRTRPREPRPATRPLRPRRRRTLRSRLSSRSSTASSRRPSGAGRTRSS